MPQVHFFFVFSALISTSFSEQCQESGVRLVTIWRPATVSNHFVLSGIVTGSSAAVMHEGLTGLQGSRDGGLTGLQGSRDGGLTGLQCTCDGGV